MVSRLNQEIAIRIMNEIRIHNIEAGGTTMGIIAEKGSGKTQFALRLANQILYIHPVKNIPLRETILWRGRSDDYWSWMYEPDFEWEGPEFRRKVYVHYHEDDTPTFAHKTMSGQRGEPIAFPPDALKTYRWPIDLYHNLVLGEFNVIYEPSKYVMSQEMLDRVVTRSCSMEKLVDDRVLDPALWWVEFVSFLLEYKGGGFVSLFIDEMADILYSEVSDVRWHMQGIFSNIARDLRKNNISLYYTVHRTSDLDYRIFPKTQYKGYMFEGNLRPGSRIPKGATSNLPVGDIILERGGYGTTNLGKLKHRDLVHVSFAEAKQDFSKWCTPGTTKKHETRSRLELTCPLCGYTWTPKTSAPKRCPNCNASLTIEEEWVEVEE
jgi:ssDNA-binding Zn-finger/Zn-ribbon topoisomerase 1